MQTTGKLQLLGPVPVQMAGPVWWQIDVWVPPFFLGSRLPHSLISARRKPGCPKKKMRLSKEGGGGGGGVRVGWLGEVWIVAKKCGLLVVADQQYVRFSMGFVVLWLVPRVFLPGVWAVARVRAICRPCQEMCGSGPHLRWVSNSTHIIGDLV